MCKDITKAQHIWDQYKSIQPPKGQLHPEMICGCTKSVCITNMYRCLYCGVWFCAKCAEIHFGKTREQYKKEKTND